MSEWLTTGQMIDRLKVGEVAEARPWDGMPIGKIRVTKTYDGAICFENSNDCLSLNQLNTSLQWRILPRYVSFEEAMKAFKEGKRVALYISGYKETFRLNEELDSLTLRDLIEGKWTIEE
jgi:hypothetical protein